MASSGAHRARAAASSASFDQALRKNQPPEKELTRPAERAAEPAEALEGKASRETADAEDHDGDPAEPVANGASPEGAESELENESPVPEVEGSSAPDSAQPEQGHPADGVTNPATLNQAAEIVLRGADVRPAQPITIRAFNRRLLDGDTPGNRDPGKSASGSVMPEDNAQTVLTRPELGRRGPTGEEGRESLPAEREERSVAAERGSPPPCDSDSASHREASMSREARSASNDGASGGESGAGVPPPPVEQPRARFPMHSIASAVSAARPAPTVTEVPGSHLNALRNLLSGSGGTESSKATRPGVNPEPGSADSEFRRQLVAQVSRGLSGAIVKREGVNGSAGASGGAETLILKLRPEALGQVKVTLEWRDTAATGQEKGVSARFEVHSKHTHDALNGALDELRSSLESRGLSVENVEVKLVKTGSPDPLRALGERSAWDLRQAESGGVSPEPFGTGVDGQSGFADQQGNGAWQGGGGAGGHWGGLAGGWAAGWTAVPRGTLDAAAEMVPGLLEIEVGGHADRNSSNMMTGIDTIA